MKYFIDTEFIEGFHKPLFGKKRHHIDLISIAIHCPETGNDFTAISSEYNYNDADEWVQKNVLLPLYKDTVHGDMRNRCSVENFHKIYGSSNKNIKEQLLQYFDCWADSFYWRVPMSNEIEMYGYYADYDWVLFCSLFGRMIDLPKGFPMYCKDLKQMFDEKANSFTSAQLSKIEYPTVTHNVLEYLGNKGTLDKPEHLKKHKDYPKQENEHNALADAKWNKRLYDYINSLNK